MTDDVTKADPAPETPPDREEENATVADATEAEPTETTLLTEKKPEGEQTDAAPKRNAPENYAPFTTPNDAPLDQEVLGEFTELAKGLDLSQEQAQSLIDLQGKYARQVEDRVTLEHKETINQWRKSTEMDPEIGGAKLKETVAGAQRALERFGDQDLRQLLNASGLGNHPGLVKLLAKVDSATKDDMLVEGSPAGRAKPKSLHEALYKQ